MTTQKYSQFHAMAATSKSDDKCWIKDPKSFWDDKGIDWNPSKRLLFRAKQYDFKRVLETLNEFGSNLKLLLDDNLRTAAHYAAMHRDGEGALAAIVESYPLCLTSPDVDKITPLHLSARYHSAKSWESLFDRTKSAVSLSRLRDSNGDTCAHWAARNSKDSSIVLTVKKKASSVCWKWRNNRGETVLHHLMQYCPDTNTVAEILKEIGPRSDLLLETDIDGNTTAHFAARSKFDCVNNVNWFNDNSWLISRNDKQETVLQLALKNSSKETAKIFIKQASSLYIRWYKLKDDQGNTCLHALARAGRDDVLLEAVKHAIQQSEQSANREPVQTSGQTRRWRLNQTGSSSTPGTASAQPSKTPQASENADPSCLLSENKRKSTVLHYAVENCSFETAKELLSKIKNFQNFLQADKSGNTVFHIAAKRKDKAEILNFLIKQLLKVRKVDQVLNIFSARNNKNQSVLHLAIDAMDTADFSDAEAQDAPYLEKLSMNQLIEKMRKEVLQRTDRAGNTLLHSLMQSQFTYDGFEQDILDRFKLLVDQGVKVTAHNNLNLNCLHATKLDASVLCKLLSKEKAATLFKDLLVNSKTHAHLIHTFSGQYDLSPEDKEISSLPDGQTMLDVIEKISNTRKDVLIKQRVNPQSCDNAEHGETCLHFACAYGHQENIFFLLWNGLSLWSESHSGRTCVDYAFENGNFDDLVEAAWCYNKAYDEEQERNSVTNGSDDTKSQNTRKAIKMTDIWRLLDPPQRALQLPYRQAARMTLVSITNDYGTTKLAAPSSNTKKQKTDKMVLIRALEMDSRKIFRAALSLKMITRETETLFIPSFIDTLKREEGIRKSFSRQNMFKNMPHVDATSELALIDLAAFFYRDEILPDLILTRQFELIPCCLSLLIQLDPEIIKMRAKAKGKHEQLLQLQKKVTNIAMNALNELFINANNIESELLFKYIDGKILHPDGIGENGVVSKDKSFKGPKFPYRSGTGDNARIKYGSVLELVKATNSPDLFATDCIYSWTKEKWRKPISQCSKGHGSSQNCCPSFFSCRPRFSRPDSPRAKFCTHTAAFVVFLGFFGWYILNFQFSFPQPQFDAILVAYLLSFSLQEATEIWRQRKARENCKIGPHVRSVPAYLVDWLNIVDILAVLFLLAGLIARWSYFFGGFKMHDAYSCQMILSTSFALFCLRSVSFLSYFEGVGPMINMLWSLIFYDLIPFLTILFVIFWCFGVFFTCLLFSFAWAPAAHEKNPYFGWEVFVQASTLPFNLLFTNYDKIDFSYSTDSTKLGEVAIKEGYEWFYHVLIFIFMGLANVVMMNLLIALFNLRVTQMYGVAIGIWRKKCFQMLQEYKELTAVPPPFSFIFYIYKFLKRGCKKICKNRGANNAVSDQDDDSATNRSDDIDGRKWWLDKNSYPVDYIRFLEFQAIQFRRCRSRLLRDTQWNRNDFDVVKAHTANELADLKMEVQEMLEDLQSQRKETKDQNDRHDHSGHSPNRKEADSGEPAATQKQDSTQSKQENVEILNVLEQLQQLRSDSRDNRDAMKRQRSRIKNIESKLEQVIDLVKPQHSPPT